MSILNGPIAPERLIIDIGVKSDAVGLEPEYF
jgi:hypothetical protein